MRTLAVGGLWLLAGSLLLAQNDSRVVTRPRLPSRDVLDRLNLQIAWNLRIPLEQGQDRLLSVQVFPTKTTPQIFVQTLYGRAYLLDAENGDLLWRNTVGFPYEVGFPATYNSHTILLTRNRELYALDRKTGSHRLYRNDPVLKQKAFGFSLDTVPNAGPAADDETILFSMGNRVQAYSVPNFEVVPKGQDYEELRLLNDLKTGSFRPVQLWSYLGDELNIDHAPLLTSNQTLVASRDGRLISLNKYQRFFRFEYKTFGSIVAALGQYRTIAYIGSSDATLYALDMNTGQIIWRFLSGAPIVRKPDATENDVFVVARDRGLFRLERETGRPFWNNPEIEAFVALNNKIVYAVNRQGDLHLLDAYRGTSLAKYDARDWTLTVPNEWTDRIYLAAQDGQILCMHHRDNAVPLQIKSPPLYMVPKKIEEPKVEEKKVEEEKK